MLPLFPSPSRGDRGQALIPGLVNKAWAPASTAAMPGGPRRAVIPHKAHHWPVPCQLPPRTPGPGTDDVPHTSSSSLWAHWVSKDRVGRPAPVSSSGAPQLPACLGSA